ncbi:dermonecrotic toxin domain-containing protein [Pseudomonas syringae]
MMDDEYATNLDAVHPVNDDDPYAAFWERVREDFSVSDYFRLKKITLQSPATQACDDIRQECLSRWGVEVEPDETLIATVYLEDPRVYPVPLRANVAHSMTLTQALLCNWQQKGNGDWFDHLGHLQAHRDHGFNCRVVDEKLTASECVAYEAVYRKTSPQRYDSTTHLSIRADAFKHYVWDHNLQSRYLTYLQQFWQAHSKDYNLMLKAGLFRAACLQADEHTLKAEHKAMILEALGVPDNQGWDELSFDAFLTAPVSRRVTISELIVYGYSAVDLMVIRSADSPTVLLYIPGNSSPIHAFMNEHALKDWIGQLCRDPVKRRLFEAHFSAADDDDGFFYSGVATALQGFAVYPKLLNAATGAWNPRKLVQFGEPLHPWPFSHFKDRIKAKSESDALQKIRGHGDYWKAEVSSGLSECVSVLGGIAIVFPELMPVFAGLSVVLAGLGVDQVRNGRTLEERQAGLGRVVFGVLNALPIVAEEAAPIEAGLDAGFIDEAGGGYEISGPVMPFEPSIENGHAPVFRAQPPALSSLDAKMRRLLRALEAPCEWPEIAQGEFAGVYPVQGKHYIELHDRVFRVEWIAQEKQFRIRSPSDPRVWGPYVKTLDTGYWDLDLKPGLRGGESFDGSHLPPISEPIDAPVSVTPDEPEIPLQRREAKVQVELPLDGVSTEEVPSAETGAIKEKYFIRLNGVNTRIYYDADNGCWKTDSALAKPVWLDPNGQWKSGSLKMFRSVETSFPQSKRYEIYTFPRLPELPTEAQPVSRVIHHLWMGDSVPGDELLKNIQRNMSVSPGVRFHLHIDIDAPQAYDQLSDYFREHPEMHISHLKDEPFYADFLNGENGEAFHYFRHSENHNYAAASDILRYRLINEYGGIYVDCDDEIASSFAGAELLAGPNDVLLGTRLDAPSLSYTGPGNSHFASHPDNPVLRRVLKEITRRFERERQANKAFFTTPRPVMNNATEALRLASKARMKPYMTRISELTGPRLFSDVLREARPDYFDLLDRSYSPVDEVLSVAYIERLNNAVDFYFPFKVKAQIKAGSSNQW